MFALYSLCSTDALAHRLTNREKFSWCLDITLIVAGIASGIAFMLAAYHIPMGSLNSLGEAVLFSGGSCGIGLSIILLSMNLFLLRKKNSKNLPTKVTLQPHLSSTERAGGADNAMVSSRSGETKKEEGPVIDSERSGEKENRVEGDQAGLINSDSNSLTLATTEPQAEEQPQLSRSSKEAALKQCLMKNQLSTSNKGQYCKRPNKLAENDKKWLRIGIEHLFSNDLHSPLKLELEEKINSDHIVYEKNNETDPVVECPNNQALYAIANEYSQRYNIVILVKNYMHDFTELKEITDQITTPLYLGLLLHGDESGIFANKHVTPVLMYFPATPSKEGIQCVILDSVGKYEDTSYFLREAGILAHNIYYSTTVRQADPFSCRTGSLEILRNSLLSLEYHDPEREKGFAEVLGQTAREMTEAGFRISTVPAEWIFTDQILGGCEIKEEDLVIKGFYSKKKGKRPITVQQHRSKHMQPILFHHKFSGHGQLKSPIPSEMTYQENHGSWSLEMKKEKPGHIFLVRRGRVMAARLESEITTN